MGPGRPVVDTDEHRERCHGTTLPCIVEHARIAYEARRRCHGNNSPHWFAACSLTKEKS